MTSLTLYNSLSRKKEPFTPINPAHVRLYACGPTVYNYAHIGNARMAVVFDVLARVLKSEYDNVTYVSNITDVDDKIMLAARETGTPIDEITRKYEDIYNADMAALGCAPPDIQPRATGHISEMIELIETLIEREIAYESDGHVLFNVPSYDAYGKLSGRSRDEQIAGARVEVASYKKDPADFVLWKPSRNEEPGWNSPWGFGRPGWHIECSAMAEKHLGLPFDIHGGGADLKFPHHENEIAQSCGAHDIPPEGFAKFWVHNGFVTVEGEKMSKSLGNFTLVHDLLEGKPAHYGMVIRLALLSAQYSKPLDWSTQALHQAEKLYEKIGRAFDKLEGVYADQEITKVDDGVMAALRDDLNTPLALTKLNALISAIMTADQRSLFPVLKAALLNSLAIMGIEYIPAAAPSVIFEDAEQASHISTLVQERTQAKADKNWARADEIRAELTDMGVEVTDTPDGPVWRKI
jgi:cysteinyl-tRNA synthetase